MKRIAALLLCVALAAMMLAPIHSHVNNPSSNTPLLADDPPPPNPPWPRAA